MSEKKLLFSLTRKDFEWQYFRAGGKGGQNQNKVNSGVRCIHHPSSARGEARDSRDQLNNRRAAFVRCVESKEFKTWHRAEIARRLEGATRARPFYKSEREILDQIDSEDMKPENLKIEYYDKDPNS